MYVSYSINISRFSLFWIVQEPTLLMLKAAVTQLATRNFPKDDMLCEAAVQVLWKTIKRSGPVTVCFRKSSSEPETNSLELVLMQEEIFT
jgi:hypothetical protein